MTSAYLTIDDSASDRMQDLTSYLTGKGIPASFFCRGDMLEKNTNSAIDAIKKGFPLFNHTYSHNRASERDVAFTKDDIERCQAIIDSVYKAAGAVRTYKSFRYPHVDRGAAAWIVDYDRCTPEDREIILSEITAGLNFSTLDRPPEAAFAKKVELQKYLKDNGYTVPFKNITHAWYTNGEIGEAQDCLFTYSNADWMLNQRQKGKWPYTTVEDLKQKARSDRYLSQDGSVNIILAHDQADIVDVTIELIDDLAESGMQFLEVS